MDVQVPLDPEAPPRRGRRGLIVLLLVASAALGLPVMVFLVTYRSFVLPTGSMAPTLLGDHFDATCPRCRAPFPVRAVPGPPEPKVTVRATCPSCGEASEHSFAATDERGGDRIFVNRFGALERFAVVAFRYPKDPTKVFVKRVLGLPGETIQLDARGDLLVQNGAAWTRVRKPPELQQALWVPVFDSRFTDPKAPGWKPSDAARWAIGTTLGSDTSSPRSGPFLEAKAGAGDARADLARPVTDALAYNGTEPPPHSVGDLRVQATVTPAKDAGAVSLAICESERALEARIPVAPGHEPATLSLAGTVVAKAELAPLEPGTPVVASLEYADGHATLTVRGATVLEWDDPAPPAQPQLATARLGAGPGGASFADVRVDRDIAWLPANAGDPGRYTVPQDAYFLVGDNVVSSQDSREFGAVESSFVVGRVSSVWWPNERRHPVK